MKVTFMRWCAGAVFLYLTWLPAMAQPPVLVPQTGHTASVNSVAFSPDGKLLASASDDRTVLLWNVESGLQLRTLSGHTAPVMSVMFNPQGKTVASMGRDGTVIIWDVRSGEKLSSIPGNYLGFDSISFDPEGKILAYVGYGDRSQKLAGSVIRSAIVYMLDTQTGQSMRLSQEFFSPTLPLAFSPDGKTIACVENDTLRLWDAITRKESKSVELGVSGSFSVYMKASKESYPAGVPDYMMRGTKITYAGLTVTSIAFNRDSTKLLVGAAGSNKLESKSAITVVDLVKDKKDLVAISNLRSNLTAGVSPKFLALSPDNKTVAMAEDFLVFNPDGNILATGRKSAQISLLDISSRKKPLFLRQDFTGGLGISGRGGKNTFLAPSGDLFTAGRDDTSIDLWNTTTGTKLRSLTARAMGVSSIAFSTNGKFLAFADRNNNVSLYDMTSEHYVRSFTTLSVGRTEITIGNGKFTEEKSGVLDIRQMLGRDKSNRTIRIIKMEGDNVESDIPPDDPLRALIGTVIRDIEISPDGRMLATGGDDQIVRVWDVRTGNRIDTFAGHTNIVSSVVFGPDSKTLASSGDDKTIRLWDAVKGTPLKTLSEKSLGRILTVAFSPDGKILASGDDSKLITLWDVTTGAQLRRLTGSNQSVYHVVFNPDGKRLISASIDGTVTEWDASSGSQLHSIKGRVADDKRAVFRQDGQVLAIGRDDGRIAFLNPITNEVLGYLIPLDENNWLTVTPDGLFDGTPGAWKQVIWRSVNNTLDFVPVEAFFNEFYYPGLLFEIMAGKRPKAKRDLADLDRRQPQVKLESSASGTVSNMRDVSVRVEVAEAPTENRHQDRGSGAQDVRLFRNGSLVKVWRGDVLNGRTACTLDASIPIVAGENQFTAYAFNHDNVKSSDATLTITGADSLKRQGVGYVIAVGVNEYANSQYNLKYAVADAQDFGEQLKRQQTRLNNYQDVEVISLNDRDATKANILKALADISAKIQPEDALVIFFAGHGTAQQNRFYLIPHDLGYTGRRTQLDSAALRNILAHSISDEELERAVEGIDAGQMLLIIDACNSGQALEAEEKRRGPMNSKGLAQLAYEKGMYILTAAQSYQAAQEASRLGHGYLTYALVEEGLKTSAADREPRDGQVLLREWLDYATDRVPQMQQDELEEQLKLGRQLDRIKFAEADSGNERSLQRPRVFYRRETEPHPLVVARP